MPAPRLRDRSVIPVYHVITPGDHFSPLTGSAIPTVVHGLATGARLAGDSRRFPQNVVVQSGTYTPRYASANAIEFTGTSYPALPHRVADAVRARVGLSRSAARRYYAPALASLTAARPGVVVAHNAPIVAAFAGTHHHSTILFAHNDVLRTYTRSEALRVVSGAQRIVCVSRSLSDEIRSHLPAALHDRVRVVLNGVDSEQFAPQQAEPPEKSPRLRVVFLGRMIPDKGADTLVDAIIRLGRGDIDTRIIGSHGFNPSASLTAYERRLRERAASALSPIRFEPFVDRARLPELLHNADVLVVPSRWKDPCPLTVGEGLAAGLVVVGARIGGIPEIIGDAGILVEPEDPAGLARAIAQVADDPGLRMTLQRKALTRSTDHDWTWAWRHFASVLLEEGACR